MGLSENSVSGYGCVWKLCIWLVVLTILKNMKVNGKDYIQYMKWTIKTMFETTNQKSKISKEPPSAHNKRVRIYANNSAFR